MKSMGVLLTCHNRRAKTLDCLTALSRQELPTGLAMKVYLVDDGSTDGTGEAVRQTYPDVVLLPGDGNLFWNRGMRLAFDTALRANHDGYLWINDDTILYPEAVGTLLGTLRRLVDNGHCQSIVVGSTRDPVTGAHTYGGIVRSSHWHPLKFRGVEPRDEPVQCGTMNGNCALIPREVAEIVGNLDPAFRHAIGDMDYALRAVQRGCTVWIAPGYVGTCARNSTTATWMDQSIPLSERWRKVKQPKGLPVEAYRVFAKRWGGTFWPVHWLLPYTRLVLTALRARLLPSGAKRH